MGCRSSSSSVQACPPLSLQMMTMTRKIVMDEVNSLLDMMPEDNGAVFFSLLLLQHQNQKLMSKLMLAAASLDEVYYGWFESSSLLD